MKQLEAPLDTLEPRIKMVLDLGLPIVPLLVPLGHLTPHVNICNEQTLRFPRNLH